jgi:hypothetical protein
MKYKIMAQHANIMRNPEISRSNDENTVENQVLESRVR